LHRTAKSAKETPQILAEKRSGVGKNADSLYIHIISAMRGRRLDSTVKYAGTARRRC